MITRTDYQLMEVSQGGRCFYCDQPIGAHATDDHVVPRAYGGPDVPGNIVLAHLRCNRLKSDRLPNCEEIRRLVDQRRRSRLGVWPPILSLLHAEPGQEWLVLAQAIRTAGG